MPNRRGIVKESERVGERERMKEKKDSGHVTANNFLRSSYLFAAISARLFLTDKENVNDENNKCSVSNRDGGYSQAV